MNETTPEKLLRQERDDAVLAHHLALAYIKTLEAEVELQTEHSLTSWVLDAVLRLGWKPPALAAKPK